jgi:hypothetical protein
VRRGSADRDRVDEARHFQLESVKDTLNGLKENVIIGKPGHHRFCSTPSSCSRRFGSV